VSHYRNRPVARGRRSGSAASFARKASAVFAIWSENAFLEIIRNRCDTKTCTPPLPINTYLSTPIYQHLSINTYLADGSRRHMGASVDGQRLHLLVDESLNEPTHILVPGDKVAERRHVEHKHLGARTVTCCLAMLQQRRNPHT